MKRREELVQIHLQEANGDPRRALEDLQRAFEKVTLKDPEEFVAHLMARDVLTEMVKDVCFRKANMEQVI